ncbi:hypothetical protein QZH41_019954, partial [Actinostola sp. cb2023]
SRKLYWTDVSENFAPFLVEDASWGKKSKADPLRGFVNDGEEVPTARRRTAQQKSTMLELMLGQIANYCQIISRSTLVKGSTSLDSIWQAIRLHFGFQTTGAHFIDFNSIALEPDERPEDLYQRLMAFVEDCLLKANELTHHSDAVQEDEELSPTVENFVVLTWLRLIHPELPKLVKQRYGTELRSRTLASIKAEISQALSSLLDEIQAADDTKILRAGVTPYTRRTSQPYKPVARTPARPNRPLKTCPLCKQTGRQSHNHFLSECNFLPEQDRKYIVKARQIASILDDDPDETTDDYCTNLR